MQAVITFNIRFVFTLLLLISDLSSHLQVGLVQVLSVKCHFLQLAAYNVCLNIIMQLMPD